MFNFVVKKHTYCRGETMEVRHYKCSGFCPNSRVAKNTKDLGRGNLPFSSEGGCVGSYL